MSWGPAPGPPGAGAMARPQGSFRGDAVIHDEVQLAASGEIVPLLRALAI